MAETAAAAQRAATSVEDTEANRTPAGGAALQGDELERRGGQYKTK